jgi:predicted acylesterase/phospholipase RssA
LNWEKYIGDDAAFNRAASEITSFVKADVRGRISRRLFGCLLRRALIPPFRFAKRLRFSATDLLAKHYSVLYKSRVLADLQDPANPRPALFLLTTNLTDGNLCSFTAHGFMNEKTGVLIQTQAFPVATAVAASSAFPGFFPPIELTPDSLDIPEHILGHSRVALTDGGVFDNLGLRKFQNIRRDPLNNLQYIIVSDASHRFLWDRESKFLEPLRTSLRASDILSKRIHDLEVEMAQDTCFVSVNIDTVIPKAEDCHALLPDIQIQLPGVRTDLDAFSDLEIRALVQHGYCAGRAAIKKKLEDLPLDCLERTPWDGTEGGGSKALGPADKEKLSRSKFRKLRMLSLMDRATYIHAGFVLAAILAFFFLPTLWGVISSPREDTTIKSEITTKAKLLRQQYNDVILSRKATSMGGFLTQPLTGRDNWVETWATSQASFALLNNPELTKDERDYIAEVLEKRFKATDWNETAQGWVTRSGSNQLQAEPALWTAGAIAAMLNTSELSEGTRQTLTQSFTSIQTILSVYHNSQNQGEAWYIFPNQKNKSEYSPYTTALALLVLLKTREAQLPWEGSAARRDELILRSANWLLSRFEADASPPGWRGIAWPPAGNDVSDGFTFQVLAELLLLEHSGLGFKIPPNILDQIPLRIKLLEKLGGIDVRGRTLLTVIDDKGEHLSECSVTFIWQPWAILTCQLWLKRLEAAGASAQERLSYRKILRRLVVDQGDRAVRQASNNSIYMSAEMLYALSMSLGSDSATPVVAQESK